jgi:hypothetical protein
LILKEKASEKVERYRDFGYSLGLQSGMKVLEKKVEGGVEDRLFELLQDAVYISI